MFKEIGKALFGVAVLPLDLTKDVVTLGGALTDEPCATTKRLGHIGKNLDKATDPNS